MFEFNVWLVFACANRHVTVHVQARMIGVEMLLYMYGLNVSLCTDLMITDISFLSHDCCQHKEGLFMPSFTMYQNHLLGLKPQVSLVVLLIQTTPGQIMDSCCVSRINESASLWNQQWYKTMTTMWLYLSNSRLSFRESVYCKLNLLRESRSSSSKSEKHRNYVSTVAWDWWQPRTRECEEDMNRATSVACLKITESKVFC